MVGTAGIYIAGNICQSANSDEITQTRHRRIPEKCPVFANIGSFHVGIMCQLPTLRPLGNMQKVVSATLVVCTQPARKPSMHPVERKPSVHSTVRESSTARGSSCIQVYVWISFILRVHCHVAGENDHSENQVNAKTRRCTPERLATLKSMCHSGLEIFNVSSIFIEHECAPKRHSRRAGSEAPI